MPMVTAIYPGSFDPFHLGHQDIANRASKFVDKLIIAIGEHPSKEILYQLQDRKVMIEQSLNNLDNIEVVDYTGPLVDFVDTLIELTEGQQHFILIRGVRHPGDFQYEAGLSFGNKKLSGPIQLETLFLMTSPQYNLLTSTMVREAIFYRKDCCEFLPKEVFDIIMFRDEHPATSLYDKDTKVLGS